MLAPSTGSEANCVSPMVARLVDLLKLQALDEYHKTATKKLNQRRIIIPTSTVSVNSHFQYFLQENNYYR